MEACQNFARLVLDKTRIKLCLLVPLTTVITRWSRVTQAIVKYKFKVVTLRTSFKESLLSVFNHFGLSIARDSKYYRYLIEQSLPCLLANLNEMPDKIRVAIIGAGPAGLGAAIEFQKLPFVDLKIYDQARALREIGTGISIQRNTWQMLDAMGASKNISSDEIFRPADGHSLQHRCGT